MVGGAAMLVTSVVVALQAQRTPAPVFRVDTELVVVDLVATDRSGRFVDDLQPSDIDLARST
jgi:hypothetical protein